jgi:hypothetical protein
LPELGKDQWKVGKHGELFARTLRCCCNLTQLSGDISKEGV